MGPTYLVLLMANGAAVVDARGFPKPEWRTRVDEAFRGFKVGRR